MAIHKVFPKGKWQIAQAIARAESGLNPRAVSYTSDHGCFQINLASHYRNGLWRGKYGFSQVYDPMVNAKLDYEISGGGDWWRPWVTYTTNTYARYL